jgi:hypothetical protein
MPDMQTALKAALSTTLREWDDDGEESPQNSSTISTTINNSVSQPSQGIPMAKQTFNVSNNVSRVTFDYIKNNPGSKRKEIMEALSHQGYGEGSVSSLIAQMRRNKMIHMTNELYYADIDDYRPIKSLKAIKKMEEAPAPKRKYEKKAVTGIAALQADTTDAAPLIMPTQRSFLTKLVRTQSPEDIIGNMTVYQARELYEHLKKLFGG